jgi:hypothetical protein
MKGMELFFLWTMLSKQHEEIVMKLNELSGVLTGLGTQLGKVQQEILDRIAALEAALTDVEVPEAAVVALGELVTSVQSLDDIVPDAIPDPGEVV